MRGTYSNQVKKVSCLLPVRSIKKIEKRNMNKNNKIGPVVRPYAEGSTTLQVAFTVHLRYVTPYVVNTPKKVRHTTCE